MASIARLVVSLGANTGQFQTDMQRAAGISKREMAKMERQAKQLNDKWNRNFKMAGLAVAGGMAVAIKAALSFETAMAEVSTLIDGSTTKSMNKLGDTVKAMSLEFGKAPVDEAKALYQIISSGATDAAEQTELLTQANKLAVGGLTEVSTAADGLTSVYNAYAGTGLEATRITDIMFETMRRGKTTISELNASIGNVATIAAKTGLDFDQLGAAIATVTGAGINTSQAIDGIRGVLSALLKQTDKTREAAGELGIQFDTARLKAVGFDGILKDIANSNATDEQLSALIGRVEGLTTFMAAATKDGQSFRDSLAAIEGSAGAADAALAKMMETTEFRVDRARQAFRILGIEIGTKFLSAVAGAAENIVKHIDTIAVAVETLAAIVIARVGIAMVAAFTAAAASAGAMAAAMAILGGVPGIAAAAFLVLVVNLERFQALQNPIGDFIRLMSRGFVILGGVVQAVAVEIVNLVMIFINTLRGITAPAVALIRQLSGAISAVLEGDFKGAAAAMTGGLAIIKKEFVDASKAVNDGFKKIGDGAKHMTEAWEKSAGMFAESSEEVSKSIDGVSKSTKNMLMTSKDFKNISREMLAAIKDKIRALNSLDAVTKKAAPRIEAINKLWDETTKTLNELIREEEEYQRNLESLIDKLYPLEAAQRAFNEQLALLAPLYDGTEEGAQRYADAVLRLQKTHLEATDAIKGTHKEFDLMATAIDEGARIIERAFTSLWEDMLSGADSAFDGIMDGFKTLLANMIHQATTQQIVLNVQQGLAGTNPNVPGGGINWPQLGADIAAFLGVIAGAQIGGGGQNAGIGSALGGLVGEQLLSKLFPALFAKLGIFGGPLGVILGSVLGGILGGIFDSDRPAELNLAGNQRYAGLSSSDTEAIIKSLFGETFLTTRRIDSQALGQISQGLQEFDNAIAGFLSAGQIELITQALTGWNTHLSGEAITMEALLGSRFAVILSTFTQDIQDFVNRGEDLTSQIDRLQIGVGVQNIMDAAPDLFSGRTTADFLAVVTAFQDGTETITDAFNEVIALLDIIVVAQASLRDFADSDLGSDFEALMTDANITLTEAVAGMNAAVMDAINNFDGSPEQLRNIALMVTGIREGELKLLAQIDSIQKGINTNLDKLKADILGVTEEPKTAQELADQARGLIAQVSLATSPGEIAALAQQFEALIRQISPEDQALMQDQLLGLIDRFQTASDDALDLQRQATLDNATAMRDLVDVFLTDIGDPLAILAASNQSAADALQAIADGTESTDLMMEHHGRTEEILDGGLEDMNTAISGIGPQVASAVRSAVQNVDVNVFVTVADTDLVNE